MFIRKKKAWKNEQPAPNPAALTEAGESHRMAIHSIVMVRPKPACANMLPGANRRSIGQGEGVSHLIHLSSPSWFRCFGDASFFPTVRPSLLLPALLSTHTFPSEASLRFALANPPCPVLSVLPMLSLV